MALVTVGLPIFSGSPDEDVERHVELFAGYLNGLGINAADHAGAPSGEARARGLFRASLTGDAANWFDDTFIGKHWELYNLYNNHGQANWARLVARTMAQLIASNSFRNPSDAHTYATTPANNGNTLAASGLLPAYGLIQNWDDIGGRPTIEAVTTYGAGAGAGPVILEHIRIGNIIYWFRKNYTTVQRARRETKFGDFVQGNRPIDAYYKDIVKIGKLLEYPDRYIENQFFRGLNPDSALEAERQGDKPLEQLVKALTKIEKRKAEMNIGASRRNTYSDSQQYNIAPVQAPPIASGQEPTILKPVTSHAITQDMLNQLLKSHTENLTKNFQSQIQTLQNTLAQSQQQRQPQIVQRPQPSRIPQRLQRSRPKDTSQMTDAEL